MTHCRVCNGISHRAFGAMVLGKYDVGYHRCGDCGFVQSDEPFWLAEAYTQAVLDIDLGPINRAVQGANFTESIVLSHFDPNARFVDFGGGYGIFTRLMRDRGYDWYWADRYCENIFAKQFRAHPDGSHELVTAFEVFEHLPDPVGGLEEMLAFGRNILFTTELVPPGISRVDDWWYFAPTQGQHIAFHTHASLARLGHRFGLHFATNGGSVHLLSLRPVRDRAMRFLVRNGRVQRFLRGRQRSRLRQQSRLIDDFRTVSGFRV